MTKAPCPDQELLGFRPIYEAFIKVKMQLFNLQYCDINYHEWYRSHKVITSSKYYNRWDGIGKQGYMNVEVIFYPFIFSLICYYGAADAIFSSTAIYVIFSYTRPDLQLTSK